jgi:hypothetical protein
MDEFLGLFSAALFWNATDMLAIHEGGDAESRPWLSILLGCVVWLMSLAGGFWFFLALLISAYIGYLWWDTWRGVNRKEAKTIAPELPHPPRSVPTGKTMGKPYIWTADNPETEAIRQRSLAAMKRATDVRKKEIATQSKPNVHQAISFPVAKQQKSRNCKKISKSQGEIMRKDLSGERSNFNSQLRLDRAADQLIGICSGISADGVVNKDEAKFLSAWIAEHREVCSIFPGAILAERLASIMADGIINDEELKDLLQTLQQISGNHFTDTGAASPDSPAIQADTPDVIEFAGRRFCLTGKFVFGTRATCEGATSKLGAICHSDVTLKTDYLVIGSLVSPDWRHETYGRKIERAMGLRDEGYLKPIIITEEQWSACIFAE